MLSQLVRWVARCRAILALYLVVGVLSGSALPQGILPSAHAASTIALQGISLVPPVLHFPQQNRITYVLNVGNSTQIASVYILLIDPLGREYHQLGTPLHSADGLWRRYLQLPDDAPSGIWHVTQLVIQDTSSDASIYSNQDTHSPLTTASFTVTNPHGAFIPRMTTINMSSHAAMVNDPITFTVAVQSSTRIDLGTYGASFVRLTGPQHTNLDVPFSNVSLLANGVGAYHAIARVPRSGVWAVTKLCLQDLTGLSRCYTASDIVAVAIPGKRPIHLADLSLSVKSLSNDASVGSVVVAPQPGPNVVPGTFAVFGVVVKQPIIKAGQAEQFYVGGAAGSVVTLSVRDSAGHLITGTTRTARLDSTGQVWVTMTIPAHIASMVTGSVTDSHIILTVVVTTQAANHHVLTRSRTFQVIVA